MNGSDSTDVTANDASRSRSASAAAASASSSTISPASVLASRDLPGGRIEVAAFGESLVVELDERGAERLIVRDELGFEIAPLPGAEPHPSALRCTTMRTATLCTRPADAACPRPNTRHSTGDVSQPTRRSRMRRPSCASTSFMSSSRRIVERLADRVRRDLVEHHAPHGHLRLQHLEHVPADRLTLAVFVGCEDELVGALQRRLQLGDDLLLRSRAPCRRRRSDGRDRCPRAGRASPSSRRGLRLCSRADRGCGRRWPTPCSRFRGSPRSCAPWPATPR